MSKKEFNCPSCSAPMKFGGGESIFQNCDSCKAPIVIPSDVFYPKEQQIASGNFATLTKDVEVNPELVTNELTPGNSPPSANEVIDPEAKIEKFEIYQEKIGAILPNEKEELDSIVASSESIPADKMFEPAPEPKAIPEARSALERIKRQLREGDKIEAIKIYREKYGKSLKEARKIIDAIEKDEFSKNK